MRGCLSAVLYLACFFFYFEARVALSRRVTQKPHFRFPFRIWLFELQIRTLGVDVGPHGWLGARENEHPASPLRLVRCCDTRRLVRWF